MKLNKKQAIKHNIIKKKFDILKSVAFVTYKEWSAYRSHMAVSLFVGPVFFLVQYFIWHAVYTTKGTINGLNLEQMLLYYGVTAVTGYFVFDFADWNLSMLIHTGKFMTFLLRPVSHRYFALSQKAGHRMLSLWLEFIPMYIIFTIFFKIRLLPRYPLWAILSLLLSFYLSFLVNYSIGIIAFWLTKTDGVRRAILLFKDICAGVFIPLTFFPNPIQKILFYLPFQFITYVPTRVFIGDYELAGMSYSIPAIVGIQAIATIAMFLLSEGIYRLGIKKFAGVGA